MVIVVMLAVVTIAPLVVINTSLEMLAIDVNVNVFAAAMTALEFIMPAP